MAYHPDCLLCKIIACKEPGKKVWENEAFVAIENKYPKAPIHVLVMPKDHIEKSDTMYGATPAFWNDFMAAIAAVIAHYGLDKTGYKFVNNGAGYNHFTHEHMHVLGGSEEEPSGVT